MKDNTLNLFFGRQPSEDFLEDLKVLEKLKEKEVFGIIDKVIEWYPEDIDKKWEELSKNLKKKEKKEYGSLIGVFLFIFKEFAVGHINESELREDAKKIGLLDNYVNHFVKKLSENTEFRKRALRQVQPYRNFLTSIDWRIDRQNYGYDFGENVCIIELSYYSGGEKKVAQFELDLGGIKNLKAIFNKIEEKLCHLNKNT